MLKIILSSILFVSLISCDSFTAKNPTDKDLMGMTWVLTNIGNRFTQKGVEVTLVFDNETELSGFAGCNYYNSDYSLSGENFSVWGITSSTDSCSETIMDQEANFIITFEGAESIKLYGDNLVINSNEIYRKLKFSKR